MDELQTLESILGTGRVKKDKDISPYLTLRTKTVAAYYFEAESEEDWVHVMQAVKQSGLRLIIIGGGSNYAMVASVVPGLVVRNLYRTFKVLEETPDYADINVTSGYIVARLIKETTDRGLAGFEQHLGLPGTVGGAIFMNSKWTRSNPPSYFGDSLIEAKLLDAEGNTRTVNREYFQFAYDYSILQKTHETVLDATFRLPKADPAELKRRSVEAQEYRRKTQPHGVSTSGCFFRNISQEEKTRLNLPTTSAGYLIDKSGLKNKRIGGFVVSDLHANFIINTGDGKPQDLVALLKLIKDTVKEKFDVQLEEEVLVL